MFELCARPLFFMYVLSAVLKKLFIVWSLGDSQNAFKGVRLIDELKRGVDWQKRNLLA